MVERYERDYALAVELVDESVVVCHPCRVNEASSVWEDSRPGDRESVRVQTDILHDLNVFFKAMVLIHGDVSRSIVLHRPCSGNQKEEFSNVELLRERNSCSALLELRIA